MNGPHIKSDDPLAANLPARDGTLLNFERDGTLIRRANPNKPIYKPEYWEKVQKLDQNENESDPSYGCMPGGVPRMGPPAQDRADAEAVGVPVCQSAGAGLGRSLSRDPDGWPQAHASARSRRHLEGRIDRPLGRRHAGRRYHRLQRHQLAGHRRLLPQREHACDRAPSSRWQQSDLASHRRRSRRAAEALGHEPACAEAESRSPGRRSRNRCPAWSAICRIW